MFQLPAPVPPARLPQDGLLRAVQVGNGYNLHQNGFSLPVTLIQPVRVLSASIRHNADGISPMLHHYVPEYQARSTGILLY